MNTGTTGSTSRAAQASAGERGDRVLTVCCPCRPRDDPEDPSTRGDLRVGCQQDKHLLPPCEVPVARSLCLQLSGPSRGGAQVTVPDHCPGSLPRVTVPGHRPRSPSPRSPSQGGASLWGLASPRVPCLAGSAGRCLCPPACRSCARLPAKK